MKRGKPLEPGQVVTLAEDEHGDRMTVVRDHGRKSVLVRLADGRTELYGRAELTPVREAAGA